MMELKVYLASLTKKQLANKYCFQNWKESNFYAWNICYDTFDKVLKRSNHTDEDVDNLCTQLTAYLACWGMYRGSAFISKTNSHVHKKAIEIVLKYPELNSINFDDIGNRIDEIMKLFNELKNVYIHQVNGKFVKATDTLVTKVILGTLACTLGYDIYVKYALKALFGTGVFNQYSLNNISKMKELKELTKFGIGKELKQDGEPDIKIIDTCLHAYGRYIFNEK